MQRLNSVPITITLCLLGLYEYWNIRIPSHFSTRIFRLDVVNRIITDVFWCPNFFQIVEETDDQSGYSLYLDLQK